MRRTSAPSGSLLCARTGTLLLQLDGGRKDSGAHNIDSLTLDLQGPRGDPWYRCRIVQEIDQVRHRRPSWRRGLREPKEVLRLLHPYVGPQKAPCVISKKEAGPGAPDNFNRTLGRDGDELDVSRSRACRVRAADLDPTAHLQVRAGDHRGALPRDGDSRGDYGDCDARAQHGDRSRGNGVRTCDSLDR